MILVTTILLFIFLGREPPIFFKFILFVYYFLFDGDPQHPLIQTQLKLTYRIKRPPSCVFDGGLSFDAIKISFVLLMRVNFHSIFRSSTAQKFFFVCGEVEFEHLFLPTRQSYVGGLGVAVPPYL